MTDEVTAESKVVAVTGGLGSGKSTACGLFQELGAIVISADELARRVVAPGSPTLSLVIAAFGEGVRAADGALDRKALGAIVFADPEKRALLERITHPAIRDLSSLEFRKALRGGAPLVLYDCPLLFEAGLDRLGFKAVVVVYASPAVCIERVVKRDGLSVAEATVRIGAQLPLEQKASRATHVLQNDGRLDELRTQVEVLYRQLIQ